MKHEKRRFSDQPLLEQHCDTSFEGQWQSLQFNDFRPGIVRQQLAYVLRCVDSVGLAPGAKVLELGLGAGLASVELGRKGFLVTEVNVSDSKPELHRNNWKGTASNNKVNFLVGGIEEHNFESNSFDLIIAVGLIAYLEWDRWALQEMHRILKPGGHLVVTVPSKHRLSYLVNPILLAQKIKSKMTETINTVLSKTFRKRIGAGYKRPQISAPFPGRLYTLMQIKQILESVDFQVIDYITYGWEMFWPVKPSNFFTLKIDSLLCAWIEKRCCSALNGFGNNSGLLVKKNSIPNLLEERPIFAEIESLVEQVEARERNRFKLREAWLQKYPDYGQQEVTEYSPEHEDRGSILVLSPHPDDDIIGCGGTLLRSLARGQSVTIIQMTDGGRTAALQRANDHTRQTIRPQEAKRVARHMGADVVCWDIREGDLGTSRVIVSRLIEILTRVNPRMIFVPFLNDWHQDHIVANQILVQALNAVSIDMKRTFIVSYEVWSLVPANFYTVIDSQFDKKIELLMMYRTGMKIVDYVHFCESMHAYHAWNLLHQKKFIEVFLKLSVDKYLELAQ